MQLSHGLIISPSHVEQMSPRGEISIQAQKNSGGFMSETSTKSAFKKKVDLLNKDISMKNSSLLGMRGGIQDSGIKRFMHKFKES